MMSLRQAAQQALEASDALKKGRGPFDEKGVATVPFFYLRELGAAMEALRAALAEPEQIGNARCPRCWEPITAPTSRKPLTDEEIGKIAGDCLDAWSCARAIERAHKIGVDE